jgi:hypothetical protein
MNKRRGFDAPTRMPSLSLSETGPADTAPDRVVVKKCVQVESMTIRHDRTALKAQDCTIQEMATDGYRFVETFSLNGGEIALRFIRGGR